MDDPRVTFLDGRYYIVYAARSWNMNDYAQGHFRLGPNGERYQTWRCNYRRLGLAATQDWKSVQRLGPLSSIHLSDANGVLFPEKIQGNYVYLHRPTPSIPWTLPMHYCPGSIWILFTKQIDHWSSQRREMPWTMVDGEDIPNDYLLIRPEEPWEELKIGALGVPIPTDEGFWTFYHGVDRQGTYRLGVMLLDREDPRRVLYRSRQPLMEPELPMEKSGSYPGCIFPCSNVLLNDEIFLYYGAGDHCCCLATCSLQDLRELYAKRTHPDT